MKAKFPLPDELKFSAEDFFKVTPRWRDDLRREASNLANALLTKHWEKYVSSLPEIEVGRTNTSRQLDSVRVKILVPDEE